MQTAKDLRAAVHAIGGIWYNPITKNKYFFKPDETTYDKGEVIIMQNGSKIPITLNIKIKIRDRRFWIELEGAIYEVNIEEEPEMVLSIKMSETNKISLYKYSHNDDTELE